MITKDFADKWIAERTTKDCRVFTKGNDVLEKIYDNLKYSVEYQQDFVGEWCEFGVKNGGSFSQIRKHMPESKTLHGFDTFEGLPQEWDIGVKGPYPAGILKAKKVMSDTHDQKFWVGLFSDRLPDFIKEVKGNMAFVHIDGDLYSSCNDVLYGLNDRIVKGTVLVFDDFMMFETCDEKKWHNIWNHECRSLVEWCQSKNRKVEMFSRTNWMQASFLVLE